MFKSLKGWLKTPVSIKTFISYNGDGEKTFNANNTTFCYPEPFTKLVTDSTGKEVQTRYKLYVKGSINIGIDDAVILAGVEYDIKELQPYYVGNAVDIWVVVV